MIFVALGTQKFPLDRLLRKIDELIDEGIITEDVFAQIGNSRYIPRNYAYVDFMTKAEFDNKIEECDLLLTHSGVSTIMTGVNLKKPIVVFPRLAKYGEHVDDHQLEIAQSFSKLNYVLLCNENDDLGDVISDARVHAFANYSSQREGIIGEIRRFLSTL